ncbi:Biopolymer transport protein ExbD/TolR [Tritonibacter multivorans]|uniref:Biopolymer transport protein ExbD/TolR n=1 Tax=Tritonibacter multivorans TaxID=928856 RepID=A0A0P1G9C2_9RHOB|nr:biopolymer transporter ExbD [Tritonibacter multivorans]MDA7422939.1 biopolymer transporter ExbD [Tritonibacter multivorans]CUH78138.1 Biopolymer transport protein ExbD/TolR [Tritonibacter multivorans]SFD75000.1 biopolymer transport protein ExbD [Tritonibacter multivorans]
MKRNARLTGWFEDDRRDRTQIDSSLAMVNIVLLLIFFFIASGTILASRDVAVALPETAKLSLEQLPSPLLEIGADGSMVLDGAQIPVGSLAAATVDTPVLHVLADRDTRAITLLETLEAERLIAVELRLVTVHRAGDGANIAAEGAGL